MYATVTRNLRKRKRGAQTCYLETESVNAPERLVLVSYTDAADALGVAPETIRGAANGPQARLAKCSGLTPNTVRVDLNEARRVIRIKRPVGA
jgi:hypothetical protein